MKLGTSYDGDENPMDGYDTIEAYMIGNITQEMALGELAKHRPNNQLCLINQALIDECLRFVSVESVNLK